VKRMHVHVAVENLDHSIAFYSALFDASPSLVKPDYAKWMLEDPRVNFAISTRGREAGLDHLGIQVETKAELTEVYARLRKAGGTVIEQGNTVCCYAQSEKSPCGALSGEIVSDPDRAGAESARIFQAEDAGALIVGKGLAIAGE